MRSTKASGCHQELQPAPHRIFEFGIYGAAPDAQDVFNREDSHGKYIKRIKKRGVGGVDRIHRLQDHGGYV